MVKILFPDDGPDEEICDEQPIEAVGDESSDDGGEIISLEDGWLELESDPSLFTNLIKDMGCSDLEIVEMVGLSKPFSQTIHGFIFLYNLIEDQPLLPFAPANDNRSHLQIPSIFDSPISIVSDEHPSCLLHGKLITNDKIVNNKMFFAHQLVSNSCATHAIVSLLMNCPQLEIGEILESFKVCRLCILVFSKFNKCFLF